MQLEGREPAGSERCRGRITPKEQGQQRWRAFAASPAQSRDEDESSCTTCDMLRVRKDVGDR